MRATRTKRWRRNFRSSGFVFVAPLVSLVAFGLYSGSSPRSVAQETAPQETESASRYVYLAYTVNNHGYIDTCG